MVSKTMRVSKFMFSVYCVQWFYRTFEGQINVIDMLHWFVHFRITSLPDFVYRCRLLFMTDSVYSFCCCCCLLLLFFLANKY